MAVIDAEPNLGRARKAAEAGDVLAQRIIAMQRAQRSVASLVHEAALKIDSPPRMRQERPPVAAPALLQRPPVSKRPVELPELPTRTEATPQLKILKRGTPQDADFTRQGRNRGRGELFDHRGPSPVPAVRVSSGEEDPLDEEEAEPARRTAGAPTGSRQLFDPGRHDPVRFSSSSHSQTSSNGRTKKGALHAYSNSSASQSSATDTSSVPDSSAPPASIKTVESSIVVSAPQQPTAPRSNPLIETFRRSYRKITELEGKRLIEAETEQKGLQEKAEDWTRDEMAYTAPMPLGPTKDDRYWLDAIERQKELADAYHAFLELSADPRLPASLHTLPQKYNIPSRLWQHAFYPMLQRLRRALPKSPERQAEAADVLSHLTEFIYYAYSFYTTLLEEPAFSSFRAAWLEQLGDLARYRMLIAGIVVRYQLPSASEGLAANLPQLARKGKSHATGDAQSDTRDSVNSLALDAWDVEEQETWRAVAREWYAKGLAETPGTGRLHHHLGLLSKADDFRALYHFVRSLTASHPYISAKESIRPTLEASEESARRLRADAAPLEVFVQLHSMLFTRIALDDFDEVHARFIERLRAGHLTLIRANPDALPFPLISDVKFMMMGVINVASLLQYGLEESPLRKAIVRKEPALTDASQPTELDEAPHAILLNPVAAAAPNKALSDGGSSDGASDNGRASPPAHQMRVLSLGESQAVETPTTFIQACKLSFELLGYFCRSAQMPLSGQSKAPKAYLTVLLTFLIQVVQQPSAFELVERYLPWTALIDLFNRIPKDNEIRLDPQVKLTGHPLPEDWCLRGMDWTGRHVFGRGYWKMSTKSAKGRTMPDSEIDVLSIDYDPAVAAQQVHSEDGGYGGPQDEALAAGRWKRIALAASWFIKCVPGLAYDQTHHRFKIMGHIQSKMLRWAAEAQDVRRRAEKEKLAKEAALQSRIAAAEAEIVEEDDEPEECEDDASDSPEIKQLKARRRELRITMRQARAALKVPVIKKASKPAIARPRVALRALPGFTVLVFDTNILLNALSLFTSLLESQQWTAVIPLAVVTELDGLSKNIEVGKNAKKALIYLESHVKTHGLFLRIVTSRGNYLPDLTIRHEAIDFVSQGDGARNLDDVILRAATWQADHFADRSPLFAHVKTVERGDIEGAAKVALVTFDRNLRIKARARGLDVVGDADLAKLVLLAPSKSEADKG